MDNLAAWILIAVAVIIAGIIVYQSSKKNAPANIVAPTGPGQQLAAVMNGAQIVPQVPTLTSTAGGQAQLLLSMDQSTLQYSIYVANLSSPITSASFNAGNIGANGPVIVDITKQFHQTINAPGVTGTFAGGWTGITPSQAASLLAGHVYLIVSTSNNPNGEIRGQIQT